MKRAYVVLNQQISHSNDIHQTINPNFKQRRAKFNQLASQKQHGMQDFDAPTFQCSNQISPVCLSCFTLKYIAILKLDTLEMQFHQQLVCLVQNKDQKQRGTAILAQSKVNKIQQHLSSSLTDMSYLVGLIQTKN